MIVDWKDIKNTFSFLIIILLLTFIFCPDKTYASEECILSSNGKESILTIDDQALAPGKSISKDFKIHNDSGYTNSIQGIQLTDFVLRDSSNNIVSSSSEIYKEFINRIHFKLLCEDEILIDEKLKNIINSNGQFAVDSNKLINLEQDEVKDLRLTISMDWEAEVIIQGVYSNFNLKFICAQLLSSKTEEDNNLLIDELPKTGGSDYLIICILAVILIIIGYRLIKKSYSD